MEKLSKIRVADDLKIYFELYKIARANQTKSFKEIYTTICKNIRKDENHTDGYKEMINVCMSINYINCIGILKDEYLPFLKKDAETNKKLSFLDSCFVAGSNPNDFNKVDVLMYIRNAFFHSDSKDLYSINVDGSININMPGIGLFLRLTHQDLNKICTFVEHNMLRAMYYYVEDQNKINIKEILKDEKSCIKELSKIKLVRCQNKNKVDNTHETVMSNLPDEEMRNITNFNDYIIDSNKAVENFEFNLSQEQCECIAKHITILKQFLEIEPLLVQIIFNNLEFSNLKYDRFMFENFKLKEFYEKGNYNFSDVVSKLNGDFADFLSGNILLCNNFFFNKYKNMGQLNGDIYKNLIIYLLDYLFAPYNELSNYYSYVYSNIVNYNDDEEVEHIRNAFTHKRFCWLRNFNIEDSSLFLFDNSNDVRRPVSLSNASWTKKMKFAEINSLVENACMFNEEYHNDEEFNDFIMR